MQMFASTSRRPPTFSARGNGFTLVELLVVIAIIGILIALLLPAVQSARESGRQVSCLNHVKQMSMAMISHHTSHGYFPSGGWGWTWTGDPDRGFGRAQPAGWNYDIMPFMDQETVWALGSDGQRDTITETQRQGALDRDLIPIPTFVCPTRRTNTVYVRRGMTYRNGKQVTHAGVMDYAANAGDTAARWHAGPGSMAQALDSNYNWNVGSVQANTGISYARSQISTANIRDGTTSTYLIGEKYLNPDTYYTGLNSADDFGMYEGCAHDTYRWCHANYLPKRDTPGVNAYSIFGSAHPSTFNMSLCDGSARSITYKIDANLHGQLGNRTDGASPELP